MNCRTDCAAGARVQFHLDRAISLVAALAGLADLEVVLPRHKAAALATSLRVIQTELGLAAAALKPRPYITMTSRLGGGMPISAVYRVLNQKAKGQDDIIALAAIVREEFAYLNDGETLGICHAWLQARERETHG